MAGAEGGEVSSGGLSGLDRKGARTKKIVIALLSLMMVMGVGFFLWWRYSHRETQGPTQAAPVSVKLPEQPVATEPTPEQPASSIAPYQSERFRAGDIALGGEAEIFVPETDTNPLEIVSVRGEAFTEKGKNGAKLVITWETNKPSLSEISYGKGVGQADGVIREEKYGTNHSVVIPDLSQSSTYVYVIVSRDKWGNEAESEPYAVYTGAREVSLFELIAGAVGDVFGWAVDK